MKHVMIDIETAGLQRSNQILSIGALTFHPVTGEIHEEREWFPPLAGYYPINPDTFLWWLGQPEEARQALLGRERNLSNTEIADELQAFILAAGDKVPVWAMGITFDMPALDYQLTPTSGDLWHYRQPHDARTLRETFGRQLGLDLEDRGADEVQHSALGDCRRQARLVARILEALNYQET